MNEYDKKQLIINIDTHVNKILSKGGTNEDILVFFARSMDDIFKNIISCTPHDILNDYCRNYDGFSVLMKRNRSSNRPLHKLRILCQARYIRNDIHWNLSYG